jgi:hypothetical protein
MGPRFRNEIAAMLGDKGMKLVRMSRPLRDVFELGAKKGLKRGIEKGIDEGEKLGIERMLRSLFVRCLGRALTEQEQQALSHRARGEDPEGAQDRALSLEPEALAAWLLDSNAR